MSESKYHHLVPRTYMKPWCYSGDIVWTYDKKTGISKDHNIYHILGENYYHSIVAGSLATTKKDAETIFASMQGMTVEWDDETYTTASEFNAHFWAYDEWIFKNADV
ncbi:DUF4238 domain-containing protein [Bilifractor sp. LCP21S3_A7]|uniref:DUF4238 domain-containing protein n=1 Tax=Bilifractor sp. LCP21S3_A7 TaxID=3438738 RepID=UPI003F911F14